MLGDGQLDLALFVGTASPTIVTQSVGYASLRWMAAGSLVSRKSKADTKADVNVLSRHPIYTLSRNSSLYGRVLKWLSERNIQPTVVHSCNSLSVITELVKIGCGVAMLPPLLVRDELRRGTLRIIDADGPELKSEFFVARPRDINDRTILKIAELAMQTTIFEPRVVAG